MSFYSSVLLCSLHHHHKRVVTTRHPCRHAYTHLAAARPSSMSKRSSQQPVSKKQSALGTSPAVRSPNGNVDARSGTMLDFGHNPWKRLAAFRCGGHDRAMIVVGGQSDTFFSLNYISRLTEELIKNVGCCVVQPLFGSWYSGFGESTLENDFEEFDQLMEKLMETGVSEVILLGYSTGVQDVMYYLSSGRHASLVTRVIFQGGMGNPAQDEPSYEEAQKYKDEAVRMIRQGRGGHIMPAAAHALPISAFRYMALGGRRGVKDFFNPLQTQADMRLVLRPITVPCLLMFCLTDQYCPSDEARNQIAEKVLHHAHVTNTRRTQEFFCCRCPPSTNLPPPPPTQVQESVTADVQVLWLDAACDENLMFLRGNEDKIADTIAAFLLDEDRKNHEKEADRVRTEMAEDKRKRSIVFQGRGRRSPSHSTAVSEQRLSAAY